MNFLEKVKGILFKPSNTFDALREEKLIDAIKYYAIIALIFSAAPAIRAFRGERDPLVGIKVSLTDFINSLVFVIIGALIVGLVLHIYVYLIGGRNGIAQTLKIIIYSFTPLLLLGFIPNLTWYSPLLGIMFLIAVVWYLYNEIAGIRQLHEISMPRAVLAVCFQVIIIIFYLLATFNFGGSF